MKTRHQDLLERDEGSRPMPPVNLTERFKGPSSVWAQKSPRPRTCLDGVTPAPAENFQVLHEIFELQGDARPDAVAVMFDQEETTYADLEARANRLARQLCSRGVQRGLFVAMLLPRSADAHAALLGILKAGAAYDAEMEDGSRLDALSFLMKGERLPTVTAWAGSPAAWQTARSGCSEKTSVAEPEDQGRRLPANGLRETRRADRALQLVN